MIDYEQREVGWVITKEHSELGYPATSRVGWGQLRVHAKETEVSFGNVLGRTVFMDTSLTEHMIPEDERVRWVSSSDDGDLTYEGIVKVGWLFAETTDWSDLAFNIDRFCMEDAGDTRVWYSVDDIVDCAIKTDSCKWQDFALAHSGKSKLDGHDGLWIQIYN